MLKLSQVLLLISLTSIISLLPAKAQQPLAQGQEIKPGKTPTGLSSLQWASIRSQIATNKYRTNSHPGGGYTSSNPTHGWQIRYAVDGTTTLRPRDDKAQPYHLGIKLSAIGYQALKPLDKPQQTSTKEHTVTYQWTDHLQERWINSKNGLEQWFILDQRPKQSRAGQPLTVQMTFNSDLKASQIRHSIHFDYPQGTTITYSKLKVWDARGRILASRMKLAGSTLSLIVEDASASYPLTIDPSFQQKTYLQQAYLKASNTDESDAFGGSVAIDGNTLVVGALGEASRATGVNGDQADNSARLTGAVYVFTRTGSTWSQQAYLKASNGLHSLEFGTSVAIDGNTLVVGAPREGSKATGVNGDQSDMSAPWAGAVYVFTRTGSDWHQQAYLKASNTGLDDSFGQSVAIDGNTLVVGAPGESSDSTGVNGYQSDNSASASGAVYIFTRAGAIWSQQAYVKASNTDAVDFFGTSVAISGETIAVGARGEASKGGVLFAQTDNSAKKSGAVYVFARTGIHWSQQAYLKASNPDAGDEFGTSVAIDGNTLVVGAPVESSDATGVNGDQKNNSSLASGAAYVFERNKTGWKYQAYLKASNADAGDFFGYSVTISDDTIVVGAIRFSFVSTKAKPGAAYLFERGTSLGFIFWSQRAYLKASNPTVGDGFGASVDIFGETVAIGAPIEGSKATGVNSDQSDDSAPSSGAAYVFALTKTSLDIDGDGKAKPLTDGLLLIRYLFGFKGGTLIDNAVDPAATRTTAVQIQPYIQAGVDSKIGDIDGDDSVKPLTDGLLVIRYLFGFRGNTLIDNAVDPAATRKTASAIEAYLLSIMP